LPGYKKEMEQGMGGRRGGRWWKGNLGRVEHRVHIGVE
jgi:hypothetical protein